MARAWRELGCCVVESSGARLCPGRCRDVACIISPNRVYSLRALTSERAMASNVFVLLIATLFWWPIACAVLRRRVPRQRMGLLGHVAAVAGIAVVGSVLLTVFGRADATGAPALSAVVLPFLLSCAVYLLWPADKGRGPH